jgi:hypothetical protein
VTTNTAYTASRPSWSPDGTRFVATTNEGVAVFATDGTRMHKLAAAGTEPAWQPMRRQ